MRVFYLRFCIVLDVLRNFLCIASQCVCFPRFSALAFLHLLRRLTHFPPYGFTMRVFHTFFCTRVSLSFKTPYTFSAVGRHSACVLLAFLHRFRRLTHFPPYASQCVCFSRFSGLAFLYLLRHLPRFPP